MEVPFEPMRKSKLGTIGNQMLHVFTERSFYSTSTFFAARTEKKVNFSLCLPDPGKHNATQDSQLFTLIYVLIY